VKSGHPVSNEEEKIEHISKRSVEEKIWDKEDWSRKKLHEEAHGLFCSCGVLVSLKEDVSKKKKLGRVMGTERTGSAYGLF